MIGKLQGVSLIAEDANEVRFSLLGKILTAKPVQLNFFKDLVASLLNPKGRLDIFQVEADKFLLNFQQ